MRHIVSLVTGFEYGWLVTIIVLLMFASWFMGV